jgi:PAS domain S-box-containing protein
MHRPTPKDEEIELDPKRYLVSETDEKGIITYVNDYFIEVSGYSKEELIGQPHSILRHPDMPKVIFKLLWETIQTGHNINAVIKNLAKDGRYYWIFTEFEIKKDLNSGKIIGYNASRKAVSKHIVEIVSDIYGKLLQMEQHYSVDASERQLIVLLKDKGEDCELLNLMENIHRFY